MKFRRLNLVAPLLILLLGIAPALADDAKTAKNDNKPALDKAALEKAKTAKEREEELKLLMLFADTLDQISRNYVKDVSRRELMEAAIRGMLSELDQYSNYIPPKEIERFRGSVENEFGGVGIQVSGEGGKLTIISPIVGSPAYKAGMIAGDIITKIGDTNAKGMTLTEAIRRIKGKLGTKVKLTVLHLDGKTETYDVERALVRVQTVMGDRRKDDDSWNYFYDESKKIGYIRISGFGRRTTQELRDAVKQLTGQGLRGLVIDLRFNPGGLLSSAIEVCDMFIPKGRIVSTEGRNAPKRVWDAHKKGTFEGFPIAVLVNHFSASASEIVSACLQDHKRAVVIGERTWGKGSVQNIIQLEEGQSALKLTTAGYMRPSGKNIHRAKDAKDSDVWGVTPNKDFLLKYSTDENGQFLAYRRDRDIVRKELPKGEEPLKFDDRQLNKALAYLDKQLNPKVVKVPPKKKEAKPAPKKPAPNKEAVKKEPAKKKAEPKK